MGYNKIVYGGKTLIDLTGDSITPEKLLAGETAHDKAGEPIAGTCPFDVDSTDATATAAEILNGRNRQCCGNSERKDRLCQRKQGYRLYAESWGCCRGYQNKG